MADSITSTVATQRRNIVSRNFWYLHEKDDGNGFEADAISGSRNDPHAKPGDKFRAKRRLFKSMLRPARYRLFIGNWFRTDGERLHGFYSLPPAEQDAIRLATHSHDRDEKSPKSYIELFPGLAQGDGRRNDGTPLLTRDEGWEAVAEYNRYEMHEARYSGDPDSVVGIEWAALLEYAEPIESLGWSDVQLSESGVGHDNRQVCYPVRLVIPTAAECARYPIAKGGAS